jgi:hypothetical protein
MKFWDIPSSHFTVISEQALSVKISQVGEQDTAQILLHRMFQKTNVAQKKPGSHFGTRDENKQKRKFAKGKWTECQ